MKEQVQRVLEEHGLQDRIKVKTDKGTCILYHEPGIGRETITRKIGEQIATRKGLQAGLGLNRSDDDHPFRLEFQTILGPEPNKGQILGAAGQLVSAQKAYELAIERLVDLVVDAAIEDSNAA